MATIDGDAAFLRINSKITGGTWINIASAKVISTRTTQDGRCDFVISSLPQIKIIYHHITSKKGMTEVL